MVVSLNYCSQNGGNLYRAPYYNGNPNIGPRIIGNLDQYPYTSKSVTGTQLRKLPGFEEKAGPMAVAKRGSQTLNPEH